MPGYTYVWNGENEQTTENYRIDTDGEYYVQLKDANGNLSLPSKVISQGDAYKKEFYPSATLQHTAEKLFLTVNTRNNKLTISYPSENEHLLDICIYEFTGEKCETETNSNNLRIKYLRNRLKRNYSGKLHRTM